MRLPVTVVVPIRNEERNLADCLSRLGRFEKIVVVDSQSSDRSLEIAAKCDAEILQFIWDGRYPKKRNWVLQNYPFVSSWVLFLDADELVNDRFCDELGRKVASENCAGFWLTYENYFLGKRLRHGVPQRKLALFRVGCGLYERIAEERWSDLDMEVHEHPIIEGEIGEIASRIEHNDKCGLGVFIERHRSYAMWEARRVNLLTEKSWGSLTSRQKMKYTNLAQWWYPWAYFFYAYFVRLGFLDGSAGFYYAFYKLWYFETARQLLREYETTRGD